MLFNNVLLAVAISGFADVVLSQDNGNGGGNGNQGNQATGTGGAGGGSATTLNADALQTGSQSDGQGANDQGVKDGQAAALTDDANFINFCSGKTLTNGIQVKTGSCNGIPMGDIPATTNMVSTIITNPGPGDDIAENQDFNIQLQVANLNAGKFTNPDITYYTAPQQIDPNNGNIIGHVHVTIQTLGDDLKPQTAPDASTFVFFKGIDDAGDGNGGLQAAVAGGLPAGNYRVCSMSAAANHQPVNMPVAQRGAQDDCNKFTVGQGGGNANGENANGGNANGGNANGGNANGGDANANGGGANVGGGNAGNGAGGQQTGQQQGASSTQATQGGQQVSTTQVAQASTTQAAQGGQQVSTTQAAQASTTQFAQGGQQVSTTQAAQGGQTTAVPGGNQGQAAGGGQFGGDFGNFGGFTGRRRQYQWGPRRHRFQSRPYIV